MSLSSLSSIKGSIKKSSTTIEGEEAKAPSDGATDLARNNIRGSDEASLGRKKASLGRRKNKSKLRSRTIHGEETTAPSDGLTDLARNNIRPQPPAGRKKKSLFTSTTIEGQEAKADEASPGRKKGRRKNKSKLKSRTIHGEEANPIIHKNPSCDDLHSLTISSDDETDPFIQLRKSKNLPEKLCKRCSLVHFPSVNCYNWLCESCGSNTHSYGNCAYAYSIPRGAKFNEAMFDVHCHCGNPFFDTVNWECHAKNCGGVPVAMLVIKKCIICPSYNGDHNTFECPKDKELAARHKSEIEDYYRWPVLTPKRTAKKT